MSVYVNTNVSSLRSQSALTKATNSLDTTYNRLSTGLRINSAKDDAAGLQISDRLTSQINGLNQGNRNANDGIALAQTAEGAMDEITTMLQRIRTLATQSANGTYTTDDRKSIQAEVKQLSTEINRIACQTTFGGKTILNGGYDETSNKNAMSQTGNVSLQVGSNANNTINISLSSGFSIAQMMTATSLTSSTMPTVDDNAIYDGLPVDGTTSNTSTAGKSLSVSTAANAQLVLASIDKMIGYVDEKRGDLGAVENRLESTIRNQTNVATNESDARSRIRDTDFAEESANLSAQNIIQQASTSMLSQANSRPQVALSLLG